MCVYVFMSLFALMSCQPIEESVKKKGQNVRVCRVWCTHSSLSACAFVPKCKKGQNKGTQSRLLVLDVGLVGGHGPRTFTRRFNPFCVRQLERRKTRDQCYSYSRVSVCSQTTCGILRASRKINIRTSRVDKCKQCANGYL